MKKIIYDIIGYYSIVAVLVAYGLLSLGILTTSNILYPLLNATGAAGMILIALKKKTYQPATVNVLWLIIAIIGLAGILL